MAEQEKSRNSRSTVDDVEIRFADGSRACFQVRAVSEFFFTPVFMKFFFLAVVINAMLRFDPGLTVIGPVSGWATVTLWMAIGLVLLVWYVLAGIVISTCFKRKIITFFYTPFMTLPGVVLTQSTLELVKYLVFHVPLSPIGDLMTFVARDMLVVILFDLLFAAYVAPLHPLNIENLNRTRQHRTGPVIVPDPPVDVSRTGPEPPVKIEPVEKPQQVEMPAVNVVEDRTAEETVNDSFVDMGGERVVPSEVLLVQVEDHYLKIDLSHRKLMVRGKFTTAIKNLDPQLGLQLNRSAWIARRFISHAERSSDYKLFIYGADGAKFAVARSRWSAALEKLDGWGVNIKRCDEAP